MKEENKNQMIEKNASLFEKIKNFIRKIFGNKNIDNSEEKVENNAGKDLTKEEKFSKEIKSTKDLETERLLRLQEEFREGKITQGDLSNEDIEKLGRLYDEQIEKLKIQIEDCKKRIEDKKKKLQKT